MPRFERIPLGGLDLASPDHLAEPGALRVLENLCYQGSAGQPMYAPVAPAAAITPASAIGAARAIGRQVRQRRGDLSSQADSGLDRWVVLTERYVYLIDPDNDNLVTQVYDFGNSISTRQAQFAAVGALLLVAVTSGAGCGEPEALLVLEDDACRAFSLPQLPLVTVAATAETHTDALTQPGLYAYRWAYVLTDGSTGPVSEPVFVQVQPGTGSVSLSFTLTAYPDGVNPAADAFWAAKISHLELYLSEPAANFDHRSIGPFYRVLTSKPLKDVAAGEALGTYADATVGLSAGPALRDDGLQAHGLRAGAAFAYNGRAILGDVAYDYRRPNGLVLVSGASTTYDAGTHPYGVRFGVEIRTTRGTIERISDPVYSPSPLVYRKAMIRVATQNQPQVVDLVTYPDRRAAALIVYVEQTPGGGYKRLERLKMTPATLGNYAWAGPTQTNAAADLSAAPAMPDPAAAHAVCDRDGNRVLYSEPLRAWSIPARSAQYVGLTDDDTVLGITASGEPADRGQFGEFPLLVLCRQSMHALGVGTGEVFITAAAPLSTRLGAVGRAAFANVGGLVMVATEAGIVPLSPRPGDPVSEPLHTQTGAPGDGFLEELGVDTALGYFTQSTRRRRELWVATAGAVYAYSLVHERWFTMPRSRLAFHASPDQLVSVDAAGTLHDEAAGAGAVAVTMELAPLALGAVGAMKRVRYLGLRATGDWSAGPLHVTLAETPAYDTAATLLDVDVDTSAPGTRTLALEAGLVIAPVVTLTGEAGAEARIESLEIAYDLHAPHRRPVF